MPGPSREGRWPILSIACWFQRPAISMRSLLPPIDRFSSTHQKRVTFAHTTPAFKTDPVLPGPPDRFLPGYREINDPVVQPGFRRRVVLEHQRIVAGDDV